MIEISGVYGSEKANDIVGPMKMRLNNIFEQRMQGGYSNKIREFAIVLRVSGRLCNFGFEGPQRLLHRKKDQYLELDLGIPMKAWERKTPSQVRQYLVNALRSAFAAFKQGLAKIDKEAHIDAWEADFEACLEEFWNDDPGAGPLPAAAAVTHTPALQEPSGRPLKLPKAIKIRREKDYHTDRIGKCAGGNQFMAFVVAAVADRREEGPPRCDWYALLHKFDAGGKHLETDAWRAGSSIGVERQVVEKAEKRLDKMIAALGTVRYGNIKAGLFQVTIDGHTFGLVDASDAEAGVKCIELVPNELRFYPPWDGTYDT